jgi:hypothetical protein
MERKTRSRTPPSWRTRRSAAFAISTLLLVSGLLLPLGSVHATVPTYPTLTAQVTGPTTVGTSLTTKYHLTATGGPAVGFNGTQVGVLSFSTTVVGFNTTGVELLPTAGVLTNGSTNLTLQTSNLTETLTFNIEVTSGYHGSNVSTNITYTVSVIQPYVLTATLVDESAVGTIPFNLTVQLDGTPVGAVSVPSLTGRGTYQVTFSYVNPNLSPGWHTFTVNLAEEHGLVVFSNGQSLYSQSFYVQPAPANYTIFYVGGAAFFVAAIFIWLTTVGARRRGRKR